MYKRQDVDRIVRDFMCSNFFDIRTFGAVMTTMVKGALNCGQVRGPVQMGFARSVEPVVPQDVTITRVAITTEADAEGKDTEMGRKYIVPYGLYRCEGYVSANLARKTTGFSQEDLELLWQAILNMFENDRSAARGKIDVYKRQVYVIPYTSIIEQTAATFREILGKNNVLEHHSGAAFDLEENEASTAETERFTRASETWDAPVVVTTAVQFFESLFSRKPSRCRKLHNLAQSVVIFDEAQMLPLSRCV